MTFRHTRHTNQLRAITEFYTGIVGLRILGSFENHAGYNGIFLGFPGADWHLEFTTDFKPPNHSPDVDDLLVFYFDTQSELDAALERAAKAGVPRPTSKNPYWREHGVELVDPDGFGVVLALKQ